MFISVLQMQPSEVRKLKDDEEGPAAHRPFVALTKKKDLSTWIYEGGTKMEKMCEISECL
jgi:hypothetical protein